MTQSRDMQIFMLNLEKWRIEHNMSQTDLAKKIGLSTSAYNRLVSGTISKLSIDTLHRIYDVTGLLCHMLMGIYSDDFLRLTKICRNMTPAELNFMLFTAQNLILLREGKLDSGAGKGERENPAPL